MRHLLIVGAQRSGTSLLASLLGSQDGIAVSSEVKSRAWRHVLGHDVLGVKLCIPEQISLEHPSTLDQLKRRITKNILRPLHKRIGSRVRLPGRELSSMPIMEFFGLENPLMVGVIRDPHEVVRSIQIRGEQPPREAERQYRSAIQSIYEAWKTYPRSVMLVDFDALVYDPYAVVRKCCDRLGCDYDLRRVSGFTRNYKSSSFDTSKAGSRPLIQRLDHPVLNRDQATKSKYAELLQSASDMCD